MAVSKRVLFPVACTIWLACGRETNPSRAGNKDIPPRLGPRSAVRGASPWAARQRPRRPFSIANDSTGPAAGTRAAAEHQRRWPGTTRRGVQVTLGVLWLVDALLQMQPFMFTADFATQVVAPAGQGQPIWVAAPGDFFAGIIAAHPAPLNIGFARIQFALGIGFLFPRLVRPAIVGSLAWSGGIWWFSEGLGGPRLWTCFPRHGSPGAVLLYAVLALAAWPATDSRNSAGQAEARVAGWFPAAWAILWIGGALLQLLPSQRGIAALIDQIGSTDGVPGWLAGLHNSAGVVLSHGGDAPFVALVAVMASVGVAGLGGRPWRMSAAAVGAVAATTFWVLGQDIGELYSGQATDLNTGPLIVLMALAQAGTTARPAVPPTTARSPADDTANHSKGFRPTGSLSGRLSHVEHRPPAPQAVRLSRWCRSGRGWVPPSLGSYGCRTCALPLTRRLLRIRRSSSPCRAPTPW